MIEQPFTLPCGVTLPNRLAKAAMTEGLADRDHLATPRLAHLYRRWSEGGIGLSLTGNVMVEHSVLENPANVVIDPTHPHTVSAEARERLRAWAQAGSVAGNALWMQISHAGRQSPRYVTGRPRGPSAVQLDLLGNYATPVALTREEIAELVQRFAKVAVIARECGFGGVQIHSAHGYLLSSFLSPVTNRREDEYGGSVDNRARFLIQILRAVRQAVGSDYPISVKLNSDDFRKGGFSHADCLKVVELLNPEGVDLLEISGGTYEQPRLLGMEGKPDSVMLHWLDQGAAGWRMDVAPWVPDDFWREWRSAIRAHRPDALTVAETWFDASKFLLGDMFDSTMNYIFRNAVLEYAGGADARLMYGHLEWLREAYPPQALYALMNLLSTHDQARSLHVLGDHGPETDPVTRALAKRRLLLAMLLQMSYPGSPAIFYADEVGVTGGDDPYNRVTYPWADRGGEPDLAMLEQVRGLTRMRQEHAVLRRGSLEAPLYLDEHLIVLLRRLGDQIAIVVTNNSESEQKLFLELPEDLSEVGLRDVLAGQDFDVEKRRLALKVPALSGRVLVGSR